LKLSEAIPDIDTLMSLEPVQLHALYRELQVLGSTRDLTDDELHRGCAIMRALRRKSSGPPKTPKPRRGKETVIASEDAL
jgi:hypothetical protein